MMTFARTGADFVLSRQCFNRIFHFSFWFTKTPRKRRVFYWFSAYVINDENLTIFSNFKYHFRVTATSIITQHLMHSRVTVTSLITQHLMHSRVTVTSLITQHLMHYRVTVTSLITQHLMHSRVTVTSLITQNLMHSRVTVTALITQHLIHSRVTVTSLITQHLMHSRVTVTSFFTQHLMHSRVTVTSLYYTAPDALSSNSNVINYTALGAYKKEQQFSVRCYICRVTVITTKRWQGIEQRGFHSCDIRNNVNYIRLESYII